MTYHITRRQVLAGLGAVGLASAGAGLGTSALFSDSEAFANNTLVAGELDLKIDWQQHYDGPDGPVFVNAHPDHDGDGEQSIADPLDTDDGQVRYTDADRNIVDALNCRNLTEEYSFGEQDSLIHLDDVKPGDSGEITFSLHLCDNPGYLWLTLQNYVSQENGTNDAEEAAEAN